MSLFPRILPCLTAVLLVIAPAITHAADVVAQRGDLRLSAAELIDTLNLLDPAARAQIAANPQSLTALARERLLNIAVLAEAKAKGFDTRDDVVRRANEARDAVILQSYLASTVPSDSAYPPESEVTATYEKNKSRLMVPKQLHVAQIVLLVPPNASAQDDEEIRRKAIDLRAQAARPKANFAALAKKYSEEQPSGEKGGDVGWLREPDLLPAVREAIAGLNDNGISQPVRVPDGWHIVKLLETKPPGPLSLLEAKPQIVQALRQARVQRLMRAYLDEMVKNEPIQVNEIELTKAAKAVK